jgi:uncharacterized protein (TIGR02284 family)
MTDQDTTITLLKQLYTVNEESADGFRDAAEVAETEGLDTIFREIAQDRRKYAERIADHIRHLGGNPEESLVTGIAADMHQFWTQARATLSDGDEALLKSVRTGERQADEAYEFVLDQDIPDDIKETLAAQHANVHQCRVRFENMAETASS